MLVNDTVSIAAPPPRHGTSMTTRSMEQSAARRLWGCEQAWGFVQLSVEGSQRIFGEGDRHHYAVATA